MCGIIAALAYGEFEEKRMEKVRQESMIFLASELLQLTQGRGKDATGVATMFSNCDYMGLKMGVPAQEFIARFGGKETDYEGYLKVWRKKETTPAKIVIGHCRKPSVATTATPDDNKNNHPIKVGEIVGVHNGTLTNHEKIFKNLACKRDGVVDSEAIFRLLSHYTANGTEPFTTQAIQETCKRLSGTYSVLAFSGNNPFQLAAFRDGKPLEILVIKPLKLVLLASEKDFLRTALFRYNKMANLYQTGVLKFISLTKGDVEEATLADDSLFLFDVRKDIVADTKITDLFITEKIPRTDKIWVAKSYVTTTYNHGVVHSAVSYNNPSAVKKTQVSATNAQHSHTGGVEDTTIKTLQTGATDDVKRLGMAWNRASAHYESVKNLDATKEHGNIEIDCVEDEGMEIVPGQISAKKKLADICAEQTPTVLVPMVIAPKHTIIVSEKPVDDLISNPAKITEIVINKGTDATNAIIAMHKGGVTTSGDKVIESFKKKEVTAKSVVEIDFTTHPDVLEAAVDASIKHPSFSNNDDLANALQITDKNALENMELYSLANRIKRFFFKAGWYAGYISRLGEETSYDQNQGLRNILNRAVAKRRSAQDTIRSMKTITRVMSRIIDYFPAGSINDRFINKAIEETFDNAEEIGPAILRKAFKEGDLKELPVLRKIITSVENKENK
jgi:hypothetical protein